MCKSAGQGLICDHADVSGLSQTLVTSRNAFLGFLMKRLGNRADAEDVLQEFCMRVLARKDQLREVDRIALGGVQQDPSLASHVFAEYPTY